MKNLKLSLVILSWNTKAVLRDCLRSVFRELKRLGADSEVIVVDNHSTDGSVEMIRKEFPRTVLIVNGENRGFSAGNNQGIRAARGKAVMLLNSDTVTERKSIRQLVDYLFEHQEVGAVSPLLVLPNGERQTDYYMRFPSLWQVVFYHNRILRLVSMHTPLRWLIISRTKRHQPFFLDQLPAAAMMARREVWDKVGLLDENFEFFFEDVDWSWRAQKKGFKLAVVPKARIIHLGGESWKKKASQDSYQFYRRYFGSMLIFVRKNYGLLMGHVFRLALVVNFLSRFKVKLGWSFFTRAQIKERLWQS